jgi:hypothetical protein
VSPVPVPPVAVAGVGQPLTIYEPPGHDRSAHPDSLTTSPRPPTPAPNHVHDQLITTATAITSTITRTTINHHQKPTHTLAPCGAVDPSGRLGDR